MEQLQKTAKILPEIPAQMQEDIAKLDPIQVPQHIQYVLGHFWELWSLCGEDMTMHDVVVYQRNFAPAMSKVDMLCILRTHRAALAFIRKMEEDEEKPRVKPAS